MTRRLVIQLARFGDLLQSARLIVSLAAQGETHVVVDRSLAELAKRVYPGVRVHAVAAHGGSPGEAAAFNRHAFAVLREPVWDAVYNLNHSGLNRALAALFPPEIQRLHVRLNGGHLREQWVRTAFRHAAHRRTSCLNLVDFWGLAAPDPLPPYSINPPAAPGGRGMGVVLAGRHSRRSLPPEILAPCLRLLFEQQDGPPVFLLGTDAERPAARRLMRLLPPSVAGKTRDLTGRTDWSGLVDALTGLDALITPDTGVMHLAARLGVPVRAFFLSSAWAWETGPYGLGHVVWQAAPACAPCLESAPCDGAVCRTLFAGRDLLRSLAGCGEAPSGIRVLESAFDALGLIWKPTTPEEHSEPEEHSDEERKRGAARSLAAADLGVPPFGMPVPCEADKVRAADVLYREADWMLPDVNGRSLFRAVPDARDSETRSQPFERKP